ncbi:PaaI family thioesterase [Ornithinimicrobium avium]|uniref:PaaI family thioesterase n=1 Tax=Ornithinimicrobium avium TaxID=2283195 RepID=A0A345NK79_9MICO|nr:PaaI family thioesterase [Ornithinimicrobium avium]AXH95437.1 PaaI family thioesterase [Ornithinimicrobium avium]
METPGRRTARSSYSHYLGIVEGESGPERAVSTMRITEELANRNGVLHGGALMSLIDHCAGTLAFALCPPEMTNVTLEAKTNFFRAARVDDTVTAVATVLHVGRTTLVAQVVTTRGDGKEVSATTQTQLFLEWE